MKNSDELTAKPDKGSIYAYADGSCFGTPGPYGIGVFLSYWRDNELWYTRHGSYLGIGTNNQAELLAVAKALVLVRSVPDYKGKDIVLHTDSLYTIGSLTKNWDSKKNLDIIAMIKEMLEITQVTMKHVKGHAGHYGNEVVDKLAKYATKNRLTINDSYLSTLCPLPPKP